MHLGLQLANRLLLEIRPLILLAFSLLIVKQIDSVVIFIVLKNLLLKFEIAIKLVRMFIGRILYFLALHFKIAHEAVEDDEVKSFILAFHVVEHDIVAFIQVEYALLGYVDLPFLSLSNQED